ncbi:MAG TPA: hypothetical protein VEJ86_13945 [Candidatus Binataceae bacterium]|nr:hypothetical protein [Candidatus Binataceae bacterium]
MRHAGPAALDQLEPILAEFRKMAELKEKKRGIFYRGAKAFLHFHEDPAGMFADLKTGADYQRFRANTRAEIAALLRAARKTLAA